MHNGALVKYLAGVIVTDVEPKGDFSVITYTTESSVRKIKSVYLRYQ